MLDTQSGGLTLEESVENAGPNQNFPRSKFQLAAQSFGYDANIVVLNDAVNFRQF